MAIMPKCKSHLINLFRTLPVKSREEYLRLDMNECVPGLPDDFLREALAGVNPNLLSMYPEYENLVDKIAQHNNLDSENISLSNGSAAAIKYLFDTYVSPRDKVLMTNPTYAMYPVFTQMYAAEADVVEYTKQLTLPVEIFLKKLESAPKMAVLVNPNNPTGNVLESDELHAVIQKAAKYDVLLIVDEAYYYFYPHSIIEEIKKSSHLVVLRTFSKLFGMASIRLGYAAACVDIIEEMRKVKLNFEVNGIAVRLAERILERPELIKDMVDNANKGKQFLISGLKEMDVKFHVGAANFVLIHLGSRAAEIARQLADKGILVGSGFKLDCLQDYIRVTTGHSLAMRQFLNVFNVVWSGRV